MPDTVAVALIMAGGSIVVALITLIQHAWSQTDKKKRVATEERLDDSEQLLAEYRNMLNEHRTEHVRDRAEIERLTSERDKWQARAVAAERLVEQYMRGREGV